MSTPESTCSSTPDVQPAGIEVCTLNTDNLSLCFPPTTSNDSISTDKNRPAVVVGGFSTMNDFFTLLGEYCVTVTLLCDGDKFVLRDMIIWMKEMCESFKNTKQRKLSKCKCCFICHFNDFQHSFQFC